MTWQPKRMSAERLAAITSLYAGSQDAPSAVTDLLAHTAALESELAQARGKALEEAAKLAAKGFANRKVYIAPSPHLAGAILALKDKP